MLEEPGYGPHHLYSQPERRCRQDNHCRHDIGNSRPTAKLQGDKGLEVRVVADDGRAIGRSASSQGVDQIEALERPDRPEG